MNQFSFDFNPLPSAEEPAPSPADAGHGRSPFSLEAMAQRLESDPDFRVQRRLGPITDFGPAPETLAESRCVLVLDTETTGLSHQSDRIIELAMLLVNVDVVTGLPFGPVEVFEGFEDPGLPIPAMATEVTGITDDMVKGHRLDDGLVHGMASRAALIVAHNAGFDRPFVEARFPLFADKAWACSFRDIAWKAAGAVSLKLSALAGDQGWFYDAHRAQVDCHALLQVLMRPLGTDGTNGLSQLMQVASRPSFQLRATGSPFEAKDALNARGYRWDADAKVWGCALATENALNAEMTWLKAEVYGGRSATVEVESLNSLLRYSTRRGTVSNPRL